MSLVKLILAALLLTTLTGCGARLVVAPRPSPTLTYKWNDNLNTWVLAGPTEWPRYRWNAAGTDLRLDDNAPDMVLR